MTCLAEKDIHCGIHYPEPVHLQDAYNALGLEDGSYPVTERCSQQLVSLPMFPELKEAQIEHVVKQIRDLYNNTGGSFLNKFASGF